MKLIFYIIGGIMALFGLYTLFVEKLIHRKDMGKYEAEVIDEAEDEIYDNTGGTKTRFFKVYRYEENGEGFVVRSTRAMKRESGTVGQRVVIYVDRKERTATDKKDLLLENLWGLFLLVVGIAIIVITVNLKGEAYIG
ncbi:MAG: hypothetical protein LUG52_05460 [Clostridia bacterium]|nr:hypothetical protein [Clostridia bacterium]